MSKVFNKKDILTIPNILSLFRLLLIPVILWLYLVRKDFYAALAVILLSGFSDIVDGFIARKFNMTSNFGKIIDPIADKCTQGTLFICLAAKYPLMWGILGLFLLRETVVSALGCVVIRRKKSVNSAKWYGKLNTVVIYFTIFVLILFPSIPALMADVLILASGATIIFSWIMYVLFFREILRKKD